MSATKSEFARDDRGEVPLRILHLEDNPNDAELIDLTLRAAGIAVAMKVVSNRRGFVEALQQGGLDLIISDYNLPDFDGFSALDLTRRTFPALPFILVSGALDQRQAEESLQRGATGCVSKSRLAELPPAVKRAAGMGGL